MKIKFTETDYNSLMERAHAKKKAHRKPIRPNMFFRTLLKLVSLPDLLATHFRHERVGMERLGKREPAFYLMNHSSFIDLEIAASLLYPRPFNIVATTDGFIGKDWLMHEIGCIPALKFVSDPMLVRDMLHASRNLGDSILMYPEVGYSLDGTATTLPDSIGKCVKLLGMPLIMIRTYGAFTRDPVYNNLQRRKVRVSAKMEYLLSPEQIKEMSAEDITALIQKQFAFDNFKWQTDNHIRVSESFRADGLHRVCYKCPHCLTEGKMLGEGTLLSCTACGEEYLLDEYGKLKNAKGETKISSVTEWYRWERECVRAELEKGEYRTEFPTKIFASVDTKKLYSIGDGRFTHVKEGFTLKTDDGQLDYKQKATANYSINADFNWYEIGDIVSIGNAECLFYCLPKAEDVSVAKIRLAAEEAYKIEWKNKNNSI